MIVQYPQLHLSVCHLKLALQTKIRFILYYALCSYKHSSRTIVLPFILPQVGPTNDETTKSFIALSWSTEKASTMAGDMVSIECHFMANGYDDVILLNKELISALGHSKPRLLLGYSLLVYFTHKVQLYCIYVGIIKVWDSHPKISLIFTL